MVGAPGGSVGVGSMLWKGDPIMARSLTGQVEALRSLTGLSRAKCRRIISLVEVEFSHQRVVRRRETVAARQADLDEAPLSEAEAAVMFSRLRADLAEVRP